MAAVGALASVLALLAANGTWQLDCVCRSIRNQTGGAQKLPGMDDGLANMWNSYCQTQQFHDLMGRCETLEESSTVVPAVTRLVPRNWWWEAPSDGEGLCFGQPLPAQGECDCGAAVAEIRSLSRDEASQLPCRIAYDCSECWSAQGLTDMTWTAETLSADHLWRHNLSRLLHAARRITVAMDVMDSCNGWTAKLPGGRRWMSALPQPTARRSDNQESTIPTGARRNVQSDGREAEFAYALKTLSNYWRNAAQLLRLCVRHLSQLFIPLAFQHMGNDVNDQQIQGWIKNLERVRDMLDTNLWGLVHDAQLISEQITNYKIEAVKDFPRKYIIRRPLFSEGLLVYHGRLLSLREDFGALCEQHMPRASDVFGLADALYTFYRTNFVLEGKLLDRNGNTTDEEWTLEDQSKTTVSVDTGCLQLLADTVDHPRCPLEELPSEAIRLRKRCREQLWRDLVERPPRPPVTSYLAYTQRTSVSLCLLAWMAANSRGVCQDVPFSIMQSVHDARCYFENPVNQTCLESNATDAICSFSRAVLMLKCHDFSSARIPKLCNVISKTTGNYSEATPVTWNAEAYKELGRPTGRTLSYKESLNLATLKYKDFKVDSLKPLEYSFVAINILFRLSTASVYIWLPHLRNVPGKILLSFQLTGLLQILCSEVLYRMAGVPDVSTAVLVDSSLTLLCCLWLNIFCYQLYDCVRNRRLPDHLLPAEASALFRRQLRWALIPWSIVFAACVALEKSSTYYLMHSRVTLIVAISSSVGLNIVFLALVGYKISMTKFKIFATDKGFSKKHVNAIILSGICVIIRIGFHQAYGLAQYVYFVHIATMMQGPVLFVLLVCNGTTLRALRNRLLTRRRPDVCSPGLELCSAAEKDLANRRGERPPTAESSL